MSLFNIPSNTVSDGQGIITEKVLTVLAATELTGYNGQYLRRMLRQGKLDGIRVGQTWLIQMDSLLSYLKRVGETKDQRFGSKTGQTSKCIQL